jgi:hypothetical protein
MVLLLLGFNVMLPVLCFATGLFFACRKRRALAAVADELEEALSPPELVRAPALYFIDTFLSSSAAFPAAPLPHTARSQPSRMSWRRHSRR